ncbi:MAG: transposase [Rhizobiales bacterium 63-7]|nr:transposase [Rhizobium sp. Root1212]KRD21646.1 transposase [Rhizobium sp. Root268]OJU66572.1 MAG: transposase [Rhizobiales bacterium 63-7]
MEIGLPNGRRLTIPASLDPIILARLLPVLDAS